MTKARFKHDGEKQELVGKKCILAISVGQKYHEGDKLSSTIELINKSGFSSCTIMLGDTLQRHNLTDCPCEVSAREKANSLGDSWLDRNRELLDSINPKLDVIRWDDIIDSEEYYNERKRIEHEYNINEEYKKCINSTVFTFLQRRVNNGKPFDIEDSFYRGLEYLIEECPAIMPLWAKQGYDFIIYPQPMSQAMKATYNIFVKPNFDKANWLSLRFKKSSNSSNDIPYLKTA